MNSTYLPKYHQPLRIGPLYKYLLLTILFMGGLHHSHAQMRIGQDTLFGNEWIDYSKTYYKIPVAQDGMYKISYETLVQSGLPLNDLTGNQFQLFHLGEEIPVHVSTTGQFSATDYLLFYGEQNRGELDRHLFQDPDEQMLNPQYSMFTDTAVYYLTWGTAGKRYQERVMDLSNPPAPEAYFMATARIVFGDSHSKTYFRIGTESLYWSNFTAVEGFGSGSGEDLFRQLFLPNKHRKNFNIDLPGLASRAIDGALRIRFGCGPGNHRQILQVDGASYGEFNFFGFDVKDTTVIIPATSLSDRLNIQLEGQIVDTEAGTTHDGQTIAFAEVRYPRNFDFQNQPVFFFNLPASPHHRYLAITRFGIGAGETPVLYNLTTGTRYEAVYENGIVRILLPPTNGEQHFCLVNEQHGVMEVNTLTPVPFVNYDDQEGDFIILSHPALFDDGAGNNWVRAYADHRAGSGYRPVVVDVNQLYEQFAYGLQRHPLAVRNFANYVKRKWTDPKYFFILGKGREYPYMRTSDQVATNLETTFFVPSFGFPASDNLLLSDNGTAVPVLPVGRVPAINGKDVQTYLDKVKALEANAANPQTIPGRHWMKRIMHLGGGGNAIEQQSIRNGLDSMEKIIENNKFGANVDSYYKTSTDAIEISLTDRIFNTINEGLSIITFFGHSSPGTFDVNIENPNDYHNSGKCPLILSLGCLSGNIFTSERSIGERFVLDYQDKGAVAFGATRGYGTISSLAPFARKFYQYIGNEYYGQGIGDALRATLAGFDNALGIVEKTLVQQFNLNGDPAIRLHPAPGPDYVIDAQSVRFFPKVITAQMDSFVLSFNLVNLGQYQKDSVNIRIRQALPSGRQFDVCDIGVAAPAYSENITVKIPGQGSTSVGRNIFFLIIDPENELEEWPTPSAEVNNRLVRSSGEEGIPLFIIDNTARPVYPPNYGIVGAYPLTLKVSTTNTLAHEKTYILELDTTALFNSPLKLRHVITQRGGVIECPISMPLTPKEVYYWRVSPDSTDTGFGYAWESSSFTYIPGIGDGWNQGDYWQYMEGDTNNLRGNEERRKFQFVRTVKSIRIKNKVFEDLDQPEGYVNGVRWSDFFRWREGKSQFINIVVFDTLGQFFWNPRPGLHGSLNTTASKEIAGWLFPVETTTEREAIVKFLEDIIPDNYLVFVYTAMGSPNLNLNVDQWKQDSIASPEGKNLFNVLERQGATQIRSLEQSMRPYLFVFRKNRNKVLTEKVADSIDSIIHYETSVKGFLPVGTLISPLIGPASSWSLFQWDRTTHHEYDTSKVKLIGVTNTGEEFTLRDSITTASMDLTNVSAHQYPFLKLQLYTKDSIYFSPVDLGFWRILYHGLPDAALNTASSNYTIHSDTLQQGDRFRLTLAIENVSDYAIDSLDIQYILTDQKNNETSYSSWLPGIAAHGSTPADLKLETRTLTGLNTISISANPGKNPKERTYFNNQGSLSFYVQSDQRNPLLDVTFDGQPIMNGDLVSARPQINIRLEDENDFLLLQDTNLFEMSIEYPDNRITAIALSSNPQIQFYPAAGPNKNRAEIVFTPEFAQDGDYRLLIKARDASGNAAGAFAYEKKFRVITKKSISNVLNYPNPFSTATQFVYTLTGDQPPAFFKIQIMTTSGRIVREITDAELGPLRIGTNRTEYTWDGRDEYGDQLANGVYLYRVVAKDLQGKDFEYYDNGLQGYFKNGFGKMVILR